MCKTVDVYSRRPRTLARTDTAPTSNRRRLGFAATTVLASKTILVPSWNGAERGVLSWARQTEGTSPARGGDQRLTRSGALIATVVRKVALIEWRSFREIASGEGASGQLGACTKARFPGASPCLDDQPHFDSPTFSVR